MKINKTFMVTIILFSIGAYAVLGACSAAYFYNINYAGRVVHNDETDWVMVAGLLWPLFFIAYGIYLMYKYFKTII